MIKLIICFDNQNTECPKKYAPTLQPFKTPNNMFFIILFFELCHEEGPKLDMHTVMDTKIRYSIKERTKIIEVYRGKFNHLPVANGK